MSERPLLFDVTAEKARHCPLHSRPCVPLDRLAPSEGGVV